MADTRIMIPVVTVGGKINAKAHTARAIYVNVTCDIFVWMPSTQVFFISTETGVYAVLPAWLAKKLGYFSIGIKTSDEEVNHNVHAGKASYMPTWDNDTDSMIEENVFIYRRTK